VERAWIQLVSFRSLLTNPPTHPHPHPHPHPFTPAFSRNPPKQGLADNRTQLDWALQHGVLGKLSGMAGCDQGMSAGVLDALQSVYTNYALRNAPRARAALGEPPLWGWAGEGGCWRRPGWGGVG